MLESERLKIIEDLIKDVEGEVKNPFIDYNILSESCSMTVSKCIMPGFEHYIIEIIDNQNLLDDPSFEPRGPNDLLFDEIHKVYHGCTNGLTYIDLKGIINNSNATAFSHFKDESEIDNDDREVFDKLLSSK